MGVRLTHWETRAERAGDSMGLRSMVLTDHKGTFIGVITEMHQDAGRFYSSRCVICNRSFMNVNGRKGGFPYALGTYVEHYAEKHQPPLVVIPQRPAVTL